MKTDIIYCAECNKNTKHIIWIEDALGCSGVARIFSSIISLGISNIACTTYCECTRCGNIEILI